MNACQREEQHTKLYICDTILSVLILARSLGMFEMEYYLTSARNTAMYMQ